MNTFQFNFKTLMLTLVSVLCFSLGEAYAWTVTLHEPDGGTVTPALTEYTEGVGAELPNVTRSGYAFEGWWDNDAFTGDPVEAISTTDSGDKEFWGKWAVVAEVDINGSKTSYTSLNDALTYAQDKYNSPVITVLRDLTGITKQLYIKRQKSTTTITIDLNGHTISGSVTTDAPTSSSGSPANAALFCLDRVDNGKTNISVHITDKSAGGGGTIIQDINANYNACGVYVQNDWMKLSKITVESHNSYANAGSRAVYVRYGRKTTFEDCTFNTTANNGVAYGVADGGTTSYANCSITVSTTASATGIYSYQNTSTVSTTTMDITGGNNTRAMTACGQTPGDGTATSAGTTYRGGLIVNSGTFNVSGKNVVHGVYVYSTVKANDETSTTLGGNQTSYGQATIKGGTFTIEGTGTDVGAVYAGAQKTVSEAKKLDGTNYPSETTKNKVWILGGKFKVTTTAASQTTINKNAPVDSVTIKGGYYSDTTNFYRVTAPVKDVNYAMFPTTEEGPDYPWKICEAYVVNFKNEGGTVTLEADAVKNETAPVYGGATPFKPGTGGNAYVFDGWTTEADGGGTFYAIEDQLPPVSGAGTSYYAHFVSASAVASVDEGSNPTKYFSALQDALDYAEDKTDPEITLLDDVIGITTQLLYQPKVKSTTTIDLHGHEISGSVTTDVPTATSNGKIYNALFLVDAPSHSSSYIYLITDKSAGGGGKIAQTASANASVTALGNYNGYMQVSNITIEAENEVEYHSTTATAVGTRAVYVRYDRQTSFENCTINATGKRKVYGVVDGGPTTYTDCKINVKETKSGTSAGVQSYQNMSTFNNTDIEVTGTSSAWGLYVIGQSTTSTTTYNGSVIFNSGTVTVKGSSTTATGIFVESSINNTKNNACSGRVTVNDGTFEVTGGGDGARIFYVKGKQTTTASTPVSTANDLTVNGGKFKVTGTTGVRGLYVHAEYPIIEEFVHFQGGYYSDTTNFYRVTEPVLPENYWVIPTTEEGADYPWKVCEAYVVNFMSEDGSEPLQTGPQEKNTTPVFDGTPTKEATAEWTYTFDGWSTTIGGEKLESLPNVTAAATYYAHFAATKNSYTITWLDGDGETLKTDNVLYGETPEYDGATPTKTADAQYTYTFNDTWSPAIVSVTEAATYTAQFNQTLNSYTITWVDGDGETLKTESVNYGDTPAYSGETPTKTATAQYTYAFNNAWSPEIVPVEDDATYTAQFNQTLNSYTITWVDGDGETLKTESVNYGETPEYDGATPTKTADAQYTYTFNDTWSPTIVAVTEAATYTAQFNQTLNSYTITWVDGDGETLKTESVNYGETPEYDGATPTKTADAQYTYTFNDTWSPTIVAVTEAATYTAQFNQTLNSYTITWVDGDGETLKTESVNYGDTPAYSGETPTKTATAQYTYAFNNTWSPEIVPVEDDATYTAQFNTTVNTYTVTWKNYDGTVLETDENVPYGNMPSYDGAIPTKPTDAEHTYTFSTWYPEISSVTGNIEYTAQFNATDNVASVNIGGSMTYYDNLQNAFNFAKDKATCTITLLKDVTGITRQLYYNKSVNGKTTIDLHGHTISGSVTSDVYTTSNKTISNTLFVVDHGEENSNAPNNNSRIYHITDLSGNGGTISQKISVNGTACALYDQNGYMQVSNITIEAENEMAYVDDATTKNIATRVACIRYKRMASFTNCTLNAKGKKKVYGTVDGGTTSYTDCEINVTENGSGTSAGIQSYQNTSTVNNTNINVSGKTSAWGCYVIGQSPSSSTVYNGILVFNSGTVKVKGTSYTTGIFIEGSKNDTYDKVSSGKVTVNGGTFEVTGTGTGARTFYIKGKQTTSSGTPTANELTVKGGKFKVTGPSNVRGLYVIDTYPDIEEFVHFQGGYYSDTTNFYRVTEPVLPVGYAVLPTTEEERTAEGPEYQWKVRQAYVVTFKSEDGIETLQSNPVEKNTTPVYSGATPTPPEPTGWTFGWTTEANGGGTFYADGSLPDVTTAATYYAHYVKNVASVTTEDGTEYFTAFSDAWSYVNSLSKAMTITMLDDVTVTTQLNYTPAAVVNCTLDLNNHTIDGSFAGIFMKINKQGTSSNFTTFTITDSSVEKGGTIKNYVANTGNSIGGVQVTSDYTELILEAGTIAVCNTASYASGMMAYAVHIQNSVDRKFTMTGGVLRSNSVSAAYGVFSYGTTNISGGKIYVSDEVDGRPRTRGSAYGVHAQNGTTTISGSAEINVEAYSTATGLYAISKSEKKTTTYQKFSGVINFTGGTVNVTALGNTAYGAYIKSATTVDAIKNDGSYVDVRGIVNMRGGTLNVTSPMTALGFYPLRAAIYDGNEPRSLLHEYSPIANISGGYINVVADSTATGVRSYGKTFVSGGEFTITTARGLAAGLDSRTDTTIVTEATSTPIFNITAGTVYAYGVRAGYAPADKNGTRYDGVLEANAGIFNVSADTIAYGAYAHGGTKQINKLHSADAGYYAGNYASAGTITINGGTYNVTARKVAEAVGAVGRVRTDAMTTPITCPVVADTTHVTVNGGFFNTHTTGDDPADASNYITNSASIQKTFLLHGGYYTSRTCYNATAPFDVTKKYVHPASGTGDWRILPLRTDDPNYPTYKYKIAEAYDITFNNWDNSALQTDSVEKGITPAFYGGTPTRPDDAEYTYTFAGWDTDLAPATETATYTATYTATPKTVGELLDIVDWTASTLTINANGWAIGGWPYTINGTAYYADKDAATDAGSDNFRAPDRTIEIPYSGAAGSTITIDLQNSESTVISHRDYTVPFINTIEGTNESSIVVVNSGTLEIASAVELAELRVRPEASVNITGSLTVGKLVLRTLPWQAASINGDFTAHEVWYTRIAPNNRTISGPDGEITYSSDRYYQLAFPLPTMKPLNQVGVSHGAKTTYGKAWLLKQYEEPQRAEHGAGYEGNWHVVPEEASIEAGRGYEMANNSTYYREFYFQAGLEDFSTETWYGIADNSKTRVHYDIYNEDAANAGWNVIGSPLMGAYDNSEAGPEGIKISELQTDGSYVQSIPEVIHSGVPFSYQASEEGFLSFAGDALQSIALVRRRALTEEEVRVQWLRLELKDAQGRGDETSVLSHPTRYEETYKTGIDVAKQSLEATRALIYSSHAYGAMAFAGVSDALLENGVALTLYSPSEQELTFSLRDNNWLDRMAYVWLVDNETGMRTDLLTQDYRFDAKPGTTEGRFILQGVFKAQQGTTDIENGEASDNKAKARKLIIKDKMYIMVNDQLYDATGKQIKK